MKVKGKKILFFFGLVIFMAIDAAAGTGDAYGAKGIFDKLDGALNDTYVSAILALGGLWKGWSVHDQNGDTKKALVYAGLGLSVGSLGAIAKGISGATFL